jgi:hypothetical protein
MSMTFQMWYARNKLWVQDCEKNIPGWKLLKPEEKAYHTTQAILEFTKQSLRNEYVIDKSWNPVKKEEFARLLLHEAEREKEVQYYLWDGA